ncbi:MAG: toxin-antitoxin system HicB family antitoxin [Syntrophomonadaceae bacterium]|nr:toxin-antitoxin system HicB family antitoxin [Syntrophomonadaceae bacterium]
MTKYPKYFRIRLTDDLHKRLQAAATRRGHSVATLIRDILDQALTEGAAVDGREVLDKAIRRAIKPDIERLATLLAKSTIAGATSMYLNMQAIEDLGKTDATEMYQTARKKAVAYMREGGGDDR